MAVRQRGTAALDAGRPGLAVGALGSRRCLSPQVSESAQGLDQMLPSFARRHLGATSYAYV